MNFDIISGTNWCRRNGVDIKYTNKILVIRAQVFSQPIVKFYENFQTLDFEVDEKKKQDNHLKSDKINKNLELTKSYGNEKQDKNNCNVKKR